MRKIPLVVGIILFGTAVTSLTSCTKEEQAEYAPAIQSSDFVSEIDNTYFTLKPGSTFVYEQRTDEGLERIEVVVTGETRKVMGITTTVVWDRVWLDDELIEDTKDWYAQDREGNVWYFGEAVDNYESGVLIDHEGAWEAGVDGAKPGVIMLANPRVGNSYRQEYYKGEAEDMGDVVILNKEVTVPHGTFDNCLQTRDWSMIDRNINEYKYYCPEIGFVTLESAIDGSDRVELISVTKR